MKAFVLLLSGLFTSQCLAAKVLSFPLSKIQVSPEKLDKRDLRDRATVYEVLGNNVTLYQAQVTVGTPPQNLVLQIDTGSSDIYVLDKTADQCTSKALQAADHGGCWGGLFNAALSTTFQTLLVGGFSIKYADQTSSSGDLITDNFSVGGQTIEKLEMGLAFQTTTGRGVMGIGYDTNEASTATMTYPNLIDQMVAQGLINSKTYSLYLDDVDEASGSILFGGVDTEKFIGTLQSVPIIPTRGVYRAFNVLLTGFSITSQAGVTTAIAPPTFSEAVLLDSGTTFTYLPTALVSSVVRGFGAVVANGVIFIDCDFRTTQSAGYFSFQFNNGPTINVPISEMIEALPGGPNVSGFPFKHVCVLAMLPSSTTNVLGDSFLRSAYVVYDLTHNTVALAQSNFGSTKSNIVELQASDNGVPALSGVGTGVTMDSPTATGGQIGGAATTASAAKATTAAGSKNTLTSVAPTKTVTVLGGTAGSSSTSSSTGSASTAKSAAAGPAAGQEGAAVTTLVFAFAGACVLLGSSLMW